MKDLTSYLIMGLFVAFVVTTTVVAIEKIKHNGGHVETIFNTPIKEIIKIQ